MDNSLRQKILKLEDKDLREILTKMLKKIESNTREIEINRDNIEDNKNQIEENYYSLNNMDNHEFLDE